MKYDFNCNLVHYELKVVKHDGNERQGSRVPACLKGSCKDWFKHHISPVEFLLVCYNTITKTTLRRKGVFQLTTHRLITENHSMVTTATQGSNLEAGIEEVAIECCLLTCFSCLSACFFIYIPQGCIPPVGGSSTHSVLVLSTSIINKENLSHAYL